MGRMRHGGTALRATALRCQLLLRAAGGPRPEEIRKGGLTQAALAPVECWCSATQGRADERPLMSSAPLPLWTSSSGEAAVVTVTKITWPGTPRPPTGPPHFGSFALLSLPTAGEAQKSSKQWSRCLLQAQAPSARHRSRSSRRQQAKRMKSTQRGGDLPKAVPLAG